jgi:hypothetical protein
VKEKHLSLEELLRFGDGQATPDESVAVGRHLAECDRCAAFAREMFRDEAERSVIASIDNDIDEVSARRRIVAPRILSIAASIVLLLAAVVAVYVVVSRPRTAPPITATTAAKQPPRTTRRYDRPEWDGWVNDALSRGSVPVMAPPASSAGNELRGPSSAPAGDSHGGMSPSATAVESAQPEFSWPAVRGGTFEVDVVAGDDLVASSGKLDRNRWIPSQPLPRGRTYEWQVRVARGNRVDMIPPVPRPNPRFVVISADALRDLEHARATYRHDHLLLGVLAAHYGLREEARRELAQYAAEHPSPQALRLAESVTAP